MPDYGGKTALHLLLANSFMQHTTYDAIEKEKVITIIRLLGDAGACVEVKDKAGATPLGFAREASIKDAISAYIKK
jgi:hypothetical protein